MDSIPIPPLLPIIIVCKAIIQEGKEQKSHRRGMDNDVSTQKNELYIKSELSGKEKRDLRFMQKIGNTPFWNNGKAFIVSFNVHTQSHSHIHTKT